MLMVFHSLEESCTTAGSVWSRFATGSYIVTQMKEAFAQYRIKWFLFGFAFLNPMLGHLVLPTLSTAGNETEQDPCGAPGNRNLSVFPIFCL